MSRHHTCLLLSFILGTLFVSIVSTRTSSPKLWSMTAVDRLRHALLTSYDKFARPNQHYNKTSVKIGLAIRHFSLNEFHNTFTVFCWVRMLWTDNKLKWNSSDYEGINMVRMADHEIWQPDVMLYNSATGSSVDYFGNTLCLVYPKGEVLWVPPSQFVVFCALDLRLWPFDTQTCKLELGSWTHSGYEIDLQLYKPEVELEMLVDNTEWQLMNISQTHMEKYYTCCDEPYITVTYTFTIRRRSPTYKAIVVTPTFAIVVMTLLTFWLPSNAGEKILLNCSTAILICLFLLYFTQKCPAMGDHTPLIVHFYSSSLYAVAFSLVGSVCVVWMSRSKHQRALPWPLRRVLETRAAQWLGVSGARGRAVGTAAVSHAATTAAAKELRDQQPVFDEQHSGDEQHMLGPSERPTHTHADWLLFATAIDRLAFLIYSLLFFVLALAYSV